MDNQLNQVELLCQQLYESANSQVRAQAEKTLMGYFDSPNAPAHCQVILEQSQSPYALVLAASTLTKLVTRSGSPLSTDDKKQLRDYTLHYLSNRVKLAAFVTQALLQFVARLTKHSWFESEQETFVFRDIVDQVGNLLRGSVDHCIIGVQLLHQLVLEMNQSDSMRSLSDHRKVASSFRDELLFDIFNLSCSLLRQVTVSDEAQHPLVMWLLKLSSSCLKFDFIGTLNDESADDFAVVQIPTTWRSVFLDFSTLQLFFDLYHHLPSDLAALSVSCLVQLSSIRRSLFSTAERGNFLAQIVKGAKQILQSPQSLSDPNCYHEFCRLLTRLKSNYQLSELVRLDHYQQFIELVAKFTISSLHSWQFSSNSIHYLLSLWQRLVASVQYFRSSDPHMLQTYAPEITEAYITSRLESVETILRDQLDNLLDDDAMIGTQLDQISTIARLVYDKTCNLLIRLFDDVAGRYQEQLQQATDAWQLIDGQLTWLVYLIGCVIGGRVSDTNSEEYDRMDGQLVCRVLQLMSLNDANLATHSSNHLDLAFVSFFEQFRKIYVGDSIQKNSQVYQALAEQLGLNDESAVLNVFINKIVTNLKQWTSCSTIIDKTLQLFNDLSVGYSSVCKLIKLESVQFILDNHTPANFPFLDVSFHNLDLRYRTIFYRSLGRLFLAFQNEDEDRFITFVAPLTATFQKVASMMSGNSQIVNEDHLKRTLIGLCRDLRGIAFAFNSRFSYKLLFDWIYPAYTGLLLEALQLWFHDPAITTPILKLMAELVLNRSQRLVFDITSPNAILLFREASKALCNYGRQILTITEISPNQAYPMKLKGVAICFNMLKATLCGNYINFGVFQLYGDRALDDALNMFIQIVVSIPHNSLLIYPKLSQSYYSLLEVLLQDHINYVSTLELEVFMYILSSVSQGLTAIDTMVCTSSCTSLDHILTFLFKKLSKTKHSNTDQRPVLKVLDYHPEVFQEMLSAIFNIIMYEECKNLWSMSRPLLGLILVNEEVINIV